MDSLNIFKIHAFYVGSFLLLCLIVTLTVQWGGIHDLASYIGFGLAFTSLILSIFAIFQGLLSSSSLQNSISLVQQASQKIVENAERIDAATRNLSEQVKDVPDILKGVQLELKSHSEVMQKAKESSSINPVKPNPAFVKTFVQSSSLTGLLGIYIALRSKQTEKGFVLADVIKPIKFATEAYCAAYITASASGGLLAYEQQYPEWKISSVDDDLASELIPMLIKRLDTFAKDIKDDTSKQAMAQVDAYFAQK